MSGRPCNGLNHCSSSVLTSEVGENEEMASPTLWSMEWFMETEISLWKHKPEPDPNRNLNLIQNQNQNLIQNQNQNLIQNQNIIQSLNLAQNLNLIQNLNLTIRP